MQHHSFFRNLPRLFIIHVDNIAYINKLLESFFKGMGEDEQPFLFDLDLIFLR